MIRFAKGVLVLPLFIASSASAQIIEVPDWDNSVRFELVASQDAVRPGDNLELAVVAEIVSGYHLYGPEERKPSRTEVSVVEGPIRPAGQTVFPRVVTRDLLGLGEYDLYEGKIAIRIPVSVEEGCRVATGSSRRRSRELSSLYGLRLQRAHKANAVVGPPDGRRGNSGRGDAR